MPEFWESDSVVAPSQPQEDWWSKDSVVSAAAPAQPQTTALGALARSAATSLIPSAAFGAASRVGAPLSVAASPWVGVPVGLAAGVGAGMGADLLQRKALEAIAPDSAQELQALQAADVEQHPWASAAGRLIGGIGGFRLAPGKVLKLPPKQAAAQVATGAGIGVALPIATEAVRTGNLRAPTLPEVAEAAAFPLLYGQPRLSPQPRAPRAQPAPRVIVTAEPPAEAVPVQIGRVESVGQKLLTEGTPIRESETQIPKAEPTAAPTEVASPKMVTLYRGEGPAYTAKQLEKLPKHLKTNMGEWFTLSKKDAENYAATRGGAVQKIQVPQSELEQYRIAELDEFRIPKEAQDKYRKAEKEATPKEPVVQEQAPPPKEAPEAAGEVKLAVAEQPAPAPQPAVTPKPAESQPGEQVARAEPVPAEPVPEPRTGRQPQRPTSKLLIDPYSTPMLERLDSIGGPVSKAVAAEGRQMDSRAAELIGSISQPLDTAKRLAAKAFRGGTTWIRQRGKVTPYAAIGRLHLLEGTDRAAVVAMAPPRAQEMVGAFWDANYPAIGGMAAQANVGFAPSGKVQRILTNRGMDTVLQGGGTMWNRWVEGLAAANNKPIADVQRIFRDWKAELDQPTPDVARLDRIAQDFHRELPKVITHVRVGPKWIEMIESDPVNYLTKAAERTARAVAFREVYPANAQGQQYLAATRQAVQAELPTASHGREFDNLITVLQGHRFDVSPKMLATASASPVGALAAEAGGVITRPLRAGMLSLSAIANAAESVIGGPAIFMRFRHVLPLLTKDPRTFSKQLEMIGARDPNIRNFAFNPTKPAESVSRILSEGVNKLTLNSFMNEVQEYTGAGAAKIFADRVRAGDLTVEEQRYFRNVLRAAGFRRNPEAIVQGQDLQGLAQFERQAAPFLSGGADRPATASRWGNSRFFNALFWFHRYPQMVLNQFRGITNNLLEDARRHDWRSLGENALLMAKFLGAKAAQGALANLFVAWVKEQFSGTEQRMREAKQSFGKFVVDSAVTGFGGPLAIAMRLFQPRVRNAQDAAVELLKVSAPISSTMDAINAIGGMDKYEGLPAFERTAQLLKSKTPITPIVRSVAAIMGLADDNPKLRTARNAFYRWTEKQGWSYPKGQPKDAEFTAGMRKVAKKFETGGDYKTKLVKTLRAKAAKGEDAFKSAAQSLSHRMLLRNQHGGQLTAEEIKSLQAWLGPENFQLLQKRDAMIDALSDALKE